MVYLWKIITVQNHYLVNNQKLPTTHQSLQQNYINKKKKGGFKNL